jgi:hypothetical protein
MLLSHWALWLGLIGVHHHAWPMLKILNTLLPLPVVSFLCPLFLAQSLVPCGDCMLLSWQFFPQMLGAAVRVCSQKWGSQLLRLPPSASRPLGSGPAAPGPWCCHIYYQRVLKSPCKLEPDVQVSLSPSPDLPKSWAAGLEGLRFVLPPTSAGSCHTWLGGKITSLLSCHLSSRNSFQSQRWLTTPHVFTESSLSENLALFRMLAAVGAK